MSDPVNEGLDVGMPFLGELVGLERVVVGVFCKGVHCSLEFGEGKGSWFSPESYMTRFTHYVSTFTVATTTLEDGHPFEAVQFQQILDCNTTPSEVQ